MLRDGYPGDLHVSLIGRRDLAGQIYRQVREAIVDGRLRRGDLLPPGRELAGRLAVSRNTVTVAYDRLTAEGFTAPRVGAGTYVTGEAAPAGHAGGTAPGPLRPVDVWAAVPDPPEIGSYRYDLRTGMPDARYFPYQRWRGLMAGEFRPGGVGTGAYCDPAGHPGLRAEVARHVGLSRAVRCAAGDVIITSGMQQAMFLLARVLLEPGSTLRSRTRANRRRMTCCARWAPGWPRCPWTPRAWWWTPSRRRPGWST